MYLRKLANLGIPILEVPVNLKVINESTAGVFPLHLITDICADAKVIHFFKVFEIIDLVSQTWVKGNGPVIR